MGFIAALHTWNQLLLEHFHLHCIIPGGVWREDSQAWIPCRRNFLFGKQALADAFRNRFLKRLAALRGKSKLHFTGRAAKLADSKVWDNFLGRYLSTRGRVAKTVKVTVPARCARRNATLTSFRIRKSQKKR